MFFALALRILSLLFFLGPSPTQSYLYMFFLFSFILFLFFRKETYTRFSVPFFLLTLSAKPDLFAFPVAPYVLLSDMYMYMNTISYLSFLYRALQVLSSKDVFAFIFPSLPL
jgi:hypothetical protein